MRTASPVGADARAAGVGQRSSHAACTGSTRATGVCWSISSLTMTDHAVASGRRQGRSRACSSYQSSTASCSAVGEGASIAGDRR